MCFHLGVEGETLILLLSYGRQRISGVRSLVDTNHLFFFFFFLEDGKGHWLCWQIVDYANIIKLNQGFLGHQMDLYICII